jgi:hypothetical protein
MWQLKRRERRPSWVTRILEWEYGPSLFVFLRALFYVGIPFAALIWGRDAVIGRLLGLQPMVSLNALLGEPVTAAEIAANWADWARDVGWAVGLGTAAWAVLSAGWWAASRAPTSHLPAGSSLSPWARLREATFHEVHWAFYRNAPILELGLYWGAWFGLGLAALEALLNPHWRVSLGSPDGAPAAVMRAGMAVLSTVLFLQTQNLWLTVMVHWAVTWGLSAWTLL